MTPSRATPELDATEYVTEPAPLPLALDVTVSHGELLAALQPQPASVLIDTVPVPPEDEMVWLGGFRSIRHAAPF